MRSHSMTALAHYGRAEFALFLTIWHNTPDDRYSYLWRQSPSVGRWMRDLASAGNRRLESKDVDTYF
jgi:hypothetical protein